MPSAQEVHNLAKETTMSVHRSRRVAMLATFGLAAGLLLPTHALATYDGRNGLIAFEADQGNGQQIFTVRSDGHDFRQVTHIDGDSTAPEWSPDGRRIVFENDTETAARVEIMDADGGHVRNLTPTPACCSGDPSFTPDGRHIVFERYNPDTGDDAIWSMRTDGSDPRRIVGLPTGASDPNVSPNGHTLTFRSGNGIDDNGALFSTSIHGGAVTEVTPYQFVSIKHDWAPDGRTIIFSDGADTGDPTISVNIATVRPDGTHLRHLTHFVGGDLSAYAGSYSPDGRWILLRYEDHGNFSLYKMRTDGSDWTFILDMGTVRPRLSDWGPRPGDDGHDW